MDNIFKIALVLQAVDYLSGPLRKVTDTVKGVTADVERLSRASERLHNVGKSLQGAGKGLALGGVGGAALFGLDQVPLAALTAEHRLRALGNVGGLANPQLLQMRGQLLDISRISNQFQDDLLSGMEVLVAAGMDAQEALDLTPVIGKSATATQASIRDLSKTLFAVRDNLKVLPQDSQRALDMLAQAGKSGRFELRDMASFFPTLTAGAASLGMRGVPAVASLGAALQIAMKGAGDPSEAANNLRNFLQKITSRETVQNFGKFGVNLQAVLTQAVAQGKDPILEMVSLIQQLTGGDQFKLSELFGDLQVISFLKPMQQNLEEYRRIRQGAMKADGVVERDYQKMMETTLEQWKKLKINLATIAMPLLWKPLERLNAWLDIANQHSTLLKGTVYGIGGAIIAGGALFVLGTFITLVAKGISGLVLLGQGVGWLIAQGPLLSRGWQAAVAWVRLKSLDVQRLIGWHRLLAAIEYRGGFWNALQYWLMIGRYRMLELIATSRAWIATNLLTIAGLKGLAAATWAWTTALLANPITWVVAAVIALAGAAYLVYRYWGPISAFFSRLWASVKTMASEAWAALVRGVLAIGPALKSAGSMLIKMLVAGMASMAHRPVELIRTVMTKVRAFLPFSPAKEGPLRDLHRIRLVETIAETVRPAPLVRALSRTAAATALAAPLALAPAFAGGPDLGPRMIDSREVIRSVSSVTRLERQAGAPITIHYAPQITLGPGAAAAGAGAVREDLRSQMRADADELARLIEEAQRRRARGQY